MQSKTRSGEELLDFLRAARARSNTLSDVAASGAALAWLVRWDAVFHGWSPAACDRAVDDLLTGQSETSLQDVLPSINFDFVLRRASVTPALQPSVCKLVAAAGDVLQLSHTHMPVAVFAATACAVGGAAILESVLQRNDVALLRSVDERQRSVFHVLLAEGAVELARRVFDAVCAADGVPAAREMLLQRTQNGAGNLHAAAAATAAATACECVAFVHTSAERVSGGGAATTAGVLRALFDGDADNVTPLALAAKKEPAVLRAVLQLLPPHALEPLFQLRSKAGFTVAGYAVQASSDDCLAAIEHTFSATPNVLAGFALAQFQDREGRDRDGAALVHAAAALSTPAPVQRLLCWIAATTKPAVPLRDRRGRTALMWAADSQRLPVLLALLSARGGMLTLAGRVADVDAQHCTALMYAIVSSQLPDQEVSTLAVEALLRGDDNALRAADQAGRTPLMWAAGRGSAAVLGLLLEHLRSCGIEHAVDVLSRRDSAGRDALWYAASCGHSAAFMMLLPFYQTLQWHVQINAATHELSAASNVDALELDSTDPDREYYLHTAESMTSTRYAWLQRRADAQAHAESRAGVLMFAVDAQALGRPKPAPLANLFCPFAMPRCVAWGLLTFCRMQMLSDGERTAFRHAVLRGDVAAVAHLRELARDRSIAMLCSAKREGAPLPWAALEIVDATATPDGALLIKWGDTRSDRAAGYVATFMADAANAALLLSCLAAAEGFCATTTAMAVSPALTCAAARPLRSYCAKGSARVALADAVFVTAWPLHTMYNTAPWSHFLANCAAAVERCLFVLRDEAWGPRDRICVQIARGACSGASLRTVLQQRRQTALAREWCVRVAAALEALPTFVKVDGSWPYCIETASSVTGPVLLVFASTRETHERCIAAVQRCCEQLHLRLNPLVPAAHAMVPGQATEKVPETVSQM